MTRRDVVDTILAALLVGLLLGFVLGRLSAPVLASTPRAGLVAPSPAQLGAPSVGLGIATPGAPTPFVDIGTVEIDTPILAVAASWYCNADPRRGPVSRCSRGHPDGRHEDLFAAVSPDLARLRGVTVLVCVAGSRCVSVRIIDCDCRARHSIDLYADAFAELAPLSRGRVTVTVESPGG